MTKQMLKPIIAQTQKTNQSRNVNKGGEKKHDIKQNLKRFGFFSPNFGCK